MKIMTLNLNESQNIEFKQSWKDEYLKTKGVHRREKLEYPYEALREAVINALIHRDYTNTTNLQIRVYDDKLVMYNGATLSAEVPVENFHSPINQNYTIQSWQWFFISADL